MSVRLLKYFVCLCFLNLSATGQDKEPPYSKPPELEYLFTDDFEKDSRIAYKIVGTEEAVNWNEGKLSLGGGASLQRKLNAGSWVETEFDLEFPELTKNGQSTDLKIWLALDGTTDSFVWFRQKRDNGKIRSAIFIVDTNGKWTDEPRQELVSTPLVVTKPLPSGKWAINYRNGLLSLAGPAVEFKSVAYTANEAATVDGFILQPSSLPMVVKKIQCNGSAPISGEYSDSDQAKLKQLVDLNSQVKQYYEEGRFGDAVRIARQMVEITKSVLGEFHPNYSTGLNNLGMLYETLGEFAKAESLVSRAVQINERVLGKGHPMYAINLANLAGLYEGMGDYAKAEPLFLKAKSVIDKAPGKKHPHYATVINNLGVLYESAGRFAKAEKLHLEAISIRREILGQQHPNFAESLHNLGRLYQTMGEYTKAEPLLLQAKNVYKKVSGENHPDYADCLDNLGTLYESMGQYAKAFPLLQKAKSIREKVLGKNHPDYVISLVNLGNLHKNMGEYAKAEPLVLEALVLGEKVFGKKHPDYSSILCNLGVLYEATGDYTKAENLFLEAIAIDEKVSWKGDPDMATSLNNLGALYKSIGEYANAEPLLQRAKTINEKAFGKDHPVYAISLNSLAGLYLAMDEWEKAETLYLEAKAIREKTLGTNHPDYAISLSNLGALYRSKGDLDKAELILQEAKSVLGKKLGQDHAKYAAVLGQLGSLYESIGEYEKAIPYFLEAKEIREKALGKLSSEYASSLNNIAGLYRSMGEFEKALTILKESNEIFAKVLTKDHPNFATSLDNLGWLHTLMGKYQSAHSLNAAALRITRKNFERYSTIQSEKQQRRFAGSLQHKFSTYVSNAFKLKDRGKEVWDQAVQWKGISLVRQKQSQKLAFHPRTSKLYEELRLVKSQLSRFLQSNPTSSDWLKEKEILLANEEKLEKNISRLAVELGIRSFDLEPQNIRIPPNTSLVDFRRFTFAEPDPKRPASGFKELRYLALIRSANDSVEMVDLGSAEKIENAITNWRRPIETANANRRALNPGEQESMDWRGVELKRLVWDPLQKYMKKSELVIVSPDSALGRVPLSALPGEKLGSYLLEERKIVFLPVPLFLPELLDQPVEVINSSTPALFVGNVDYGKSIRTKHLRPLGFRNSRILNQLSFESLPGTADEIDLIGERFGSATKLERRDSTEKNFKGYLKDHKILHIATHGFFQSPVRFLKNIPEKKKGSSVLNWEQAKVLTENPDMLSGLALTDANLAEDKTIDEGEKDGVLYSAEIAMMPMEHVELAVLSACETSLGTDDDPGEGLIGIQRAFQVAGAKSVVASYWKVDDRATQLLMNKFYENLLEYSKKADARKLKNNQTTIRIDALRDAQLWMLNNAVVASRTSRGDPVEVDPSKIKKAETTLKPADKNQRTHPRYWAAFQLSGDWR